jgi:cell shape-determining protein MreC
LIQQLQFLQTTNPLADLLQAGGGMEAQRTTGCQDYLESAAPISVEAESARVVGRDPANWWKTITIDRGRAMAWS